MTDGRAAVPPGRLRAALVDEGLVAVTVLVVGLFAVQTGAFEVIAAPLRPAGAALGRMLGTGGVGPTAGLAAALSWVGVRLAYRVLGAGSPSGQTPGKRVAGLRVVGRDGKPPGYRSALVRELVLLVEVLTVVGLVGAFARPPGHDRLARTRQEPRARRS